MLKAKDIVVLLKIHLNEGDWTYKQRADELSIGTGELHRSLERCQQSNLYFKKNRQVQIEPLYNVIIHAIRYIYPAVEAGISRGVPTAHTAAPLKNQIASDQRENYVWEDAKGDERGISISPLYPKAIEAARKDNQLYECLALIDALRVGQKREQKIAKNELRDRLT